MPTSGVGLLVVHVGFVVVLLHHQEQGSIRGAIQDIGKWETANLVCSPLEIVSGKPKILPWRYNRCGVGRTVAFGGPIHVTNAAVGSDRVVLYKSQRRGSYQARELIFWRWLAWANLAEVATV